MPLLSKLDDVELIKSNRYGQRKGYGTLLMKTCLKKTRSIMAKKLYLVSNTQLTSAIKLYKKHGFSTVNTGQHPTYSRANIKMELII
jgi:N-acetylglutamate synthase-like GNAT family acetyltransferase